MPIVTRLALAASVSLCALAAPAFAQDVAPDTAGAPSADTEIVVEARRRDESVQDVPLVVNAVTAEAIGKLNLRDFKDIQTVVPGLTMNSNANGIGTTSSVRGVNFDVNASGNNGTIEYYLNDATISSGPLFTAMYDIGQIEVLRGPQGTLRGRASPSGSITITTRRPDLDEVGGYAMATANTIGGWNGNAAMNIPVVEGILGVRVAGLVEEGEGNRVHSIAAPDVDPYTSVKSGRVSVRFQPVDFVTAEGMYQRLESEARQFDQAASFSLFSPSAAASPVLIRPQDRLGIKRLPQSTKTAFDIFTWKASAGFAGQRLYYVGSKLNQFITSFVPQDEAAAYNALAMGQFNTNDANLNSHEIRLQNETRIGGMLDYVVGYFTNKLDAPSYLLTQRFVGTVASPAVFTSATLRQSKTSEKSWFGNLSLHLGESTEISGGLRHIRVTQRSSLGSVAVPGGIIPPTPVATDVSAIVQSGTVTDLAFGAVNRKFEKTIYSASVKHRFGDGFMVYANFGTSFRPGNNVVRSVVNARESALETSFLVLPSETSKAYEIGFKSQFMDDRLKVNVAAFQQDYKNYAFRSPSGVPYLNYATAATPVPGTVMNFNFVSPVPVRVRGFEAEVEFRPTANLSLSGNVAYALGKIRNGKVACLDLNRDGVPDSGGAPSAQALYDVVGANNLSTCPVNFRAMTASPWNAVVQGEYTLPVSGKADAFVRGLLTYNGNSLNDQANVYDDYGAFARVNLYLGLRDPDGAWDVTLYGKNITNNRTVLATSNGAAFSTVGASTIASPYIALGNPGTPGLVAPREFGVSARFAFGSR